MNALIVFSAVVATAQAGLIAPYAGAYTAGVYGAPYGAGAYAAPIAAGAYAAPIAAGAYAAPIAAAAYAAPLYPSTQYKAQDVFGNVNYGYANINSAKHEVGNAYGGVVGAYSYIDANGEPQTVEYIADAAGYRVKATNLPVAPVFTGKAPVFDLEAPVFDGVAPEPVMDTAEVAEAKAEFLKKFEEEKNRARRSTPADTEVLEKVDLKIKPLTYAAAAPVAYGYGYSPLAYNGGLYGYNAGLYGLNAGIYGYSGLLY